MSSPSLSETANPKRQILVVEDNRADVFLIREAIDSAHVNAELYVVHDGDTAIRFFHDADDNESAPCPALVILDINLPKRHGSEVLQHMRQTRRCANALVVVVTSSDSDQDREQMADLGANGYFRKPSEYGEFLKLGGIIRGLLTRRGDVPGDNDAESPNAQPD